VNHEGTSASAATAAIVVTPAPLTLTADDQTITYGQTPTYTVNPTGLVNGDTLASLGGTLTVSGNAVGAVQPGTYTIIPGGLTSSNYAITFKNGTLTINKAHLTLTAVSQTRLYGQNNAALSYILSGFVNGETAASAGVTGSPVLSTLANAQSSVAGSPYAITVASGTLSAVNYDFPNLVNGSVTVNKAPLTVTANAATRIYGVANPTFTASVSGFVNGDPARVVSGSPSLTTSATASSAPNTYTITAGLGSLAAANYQFAFVNGTLTVTPVSLSASGIAVSATAGAPFSRQVAVFHNADPFGSAASYTATITWGDGTTSAGVISGTGSILTVTGAHTYADPGSDTVSVRISHNLGGTTTATTTTTATVMSLGLPVGAGLAAGIGFWHGFNGQSLIKSFNGGSTSTALSAWLAATFPNLYGGNAGRYNLTGRTNTQVAAFYQSLFGPDGPKAEAQVLATALNVYATTLSLGGTAGQAYGFVVSAFGLGSRSFNVGAAGAAFGVANQTSLNVYQLLKAVNKKAVNGVLYNAITLLRRQAADLFDSLNQAGGI
jgi:hypothetical protein